MTRKAIDIVLLPDEAMTDFVIAANAYLVEKFQSGIVLTHNGCIPHISLAMGCIDTQKISMLAQILEPLIKVTPKLLKTEGVVKSLNTAGQIISSVMIERCPGLQELHEKICDVAKPFFGSNVSQDMFSGGFAGRSTIRWVKNYLVESAYEKFSPHITIGYGDLEINEIPKDFAVLRLAVCHLGDHCTCARILWSVVI